MKKKLIIGNIIAITILIGVSFTSVVGYNNLEDGVKVSPLFNIRTSRAIDEESGDLSCAYVGRYKTIDLAFPNKYQYEILISKFNDRIENMDDEEFYRLINNYIANVVKDYKLNKNDITTLVEILISTRYNPNIVKYILNPNNKTLIDHNTIKEPDWMPGLCFLLNLISFIQKVTHKHACTILDIWIPGCIPMNILEIILGILENIIGIIRSFIPFGCVSFDCPPHVIN